MKLEIKEDFVTTTIETEYVATCSTMVGYMYRLCVCAGYDPIGVAEAFQEIGEEMIKIEEDNNG